MDRWKIWITYYDYEGHITGFGVHPICYKHKSSAVRKARQLFGDSKLVTWEVDKTRPILFNSDYNYS